MHACAVYDQKKKQKEELVLKLTNKARELLRAKDRAGAQRVWRNNKRMYTRWR